MPTSRDEVIDWLMEGDPAIRWQVMRDLLNQPRLKWEAERQLVATRGWGADLLKRQDGAGTWGRGIYSPKWTSTTYTLLLLREMGLPPANARATRACRLILDRGLAGKRTVDDLRRPPRVACTCVIGMWLALPSYFRVDDAKLESLVTHLLDQQMPDGGWNCRLRDGKGAVHSSFHTTSNVLDGVREAIDQKIGPTKKLRQAEAQAIEFMLMHRMYKSDRTGKVINDVFTKLAFPFRWHYDVLRGLDYIRSTEFIHDNRLNDAFELLLSRRRPDGLWGLGNIFHGKVFFNMETRSKPSRWNTLRALRCLKARGLPMFS
jgi:hypothetical protein